MKNITISFIGAGNMATSLVEGLLADGVPPRNIWMSDPEPTKLQNLKNKYQINTTQDNQLAAKSTEVSIFAVKPSIVKPVAKDLASIIQEKNSLIISIAAGVKIEDIERWLGGKVAVVRCMPNTPAMLQSGATALFANDKVSSDQKNLAESILRAVGLVVWVDQQQQLDTVTALSGSGPAYFFLMMEALEQSAIKLGLPPETARLLTLQTALGAARMALESEESVEKLRQRVTSPGGTTEKAIEVLQQGEITSLFHKALTAAKQRAKELAEALGD